MVPSRVSVGADRGLEYWPAMRPILTTGTDAPYVRMTAIWRMVRILALMWEAVASSKDSAQSPPMRTKASPRDAAAISRWSRSASPANTSGGRVRRYATVASRSPASGQSGWCPAGRSLQALTEVAFASSASVNMTTILVRSARLRRSPAVRVGPPAPPVSEPRTSGRWRP